MHLFHFSEECLSVLMKRASEYLEGTPGKRTAKVRVYGQRMSKLFILIGMMADKTAKISWSLIV